MVGSLGRNSVGSGPQASQAKAPVFVAEGLAAASLAMAASQVPGRDGRAERLAQLVPYLSTDDSLRREEDLVEQVLSLSKTQRLALIGGETGAVASQDIFPFRQPGQAVLSVRIADGRAVELRQFALLNPQKQNPAFGRGLPRYGGPR